VFQRKDKDGKKSKTWTIKYDLHLALMERGARKKKRYREQKPTLRGFSLKG